MCSVNQDKGVKEVRPGVEHGQHVSTLTVRGAYYLDTGYYTCYPVHEGRESLQTKKIYVYVRGRLFFLLFFLAIPGSRSLIKVVITYFCCHWSGWYFYLIQ